jgi:hypothetical protein
MVPSVRDFSGEEQIYATKIKVYCEYDFRIGTIYKKRPSLCPINYQCTALDMLKKTTLSLSLRENHEKR